MAAPFVDPTDPADLTPDQRLDELARLLATGAQRLLSLRPSPASDSTPDSARNRLDVPGEQSVHAPRG